jgi:hypothetical protein
MKKNIVINVILLIYWAIFLWLSGYYFGRRTERKEIKNDGNKD